MRVRAILPLGLALCALLLGSCFCNPMRYAKKSVPIPTGDGGSITIDEGKGVTVTNDKGETVTARTEGDSGEFRMKVSTESGETTISGDEEHGTMTGPGGEVATWSSSADPKIVERIALPVYPGATGISSADMAGMCTAGFETRDAFEDVTGWYAGELGDGWHPFTSTDGGSKSASWMRDSGTVVTVTWDESDGMTRFTLARNLAERQ